MRAAFSIWDNHIAPVFDTAEQIRFIDVKSGKAGQWSQIVLPKDLPLQKILRLVEIKVDILLCGAISREMHRLMDLYGINVIPFVTGSLEEIFDAFISGNTDWSAFAMPGCMVPGKRRRSRGNFPKGNHPHHGFRRRHD
jgi:predicted Fe-Mo cluster-binding NifX family protein